MHSEIKKSSLLFFGDDVWHKNTGIHLAARGAARVWVCRDIREPLLVVLPDERQVRDFTADAEVFSPFPAIKILPELLSGDDKIRQDARKILRGDILSDFKYKGGVLAATPFSLMCSFSAGSDCTELVCGEEFGYKHLSDDLSAKGYERCDLVWAQGQYAVRGSVIDFFSPSAPFPVRIEFFDDTIESIRYFDSESQKSVRLMQSCSLQSIAAKKKDILKNYLPDNMRVVFFDPAALDITTENSRWLWQNTGGCAEDIAESDIWSLFAQYNRVRIQPDIVKSTERLAVKQLPNFHGKFKQVEDFCADLIKENYRIHVVSETERNIKWAEANNFNVTRSILGEGFIDADEKYAVLTDLEFSGVAMAHHRIESRPPIDWGTGLIAGQYVVHEDYGVALYRGTETVSDAYGSAEYLVLEFAEEKRLLIPVMQFYKISPWSAHEGEAELDSLTRSHWKRDAAEARRQAEEAAAALVKIYAEREIAHGVAFPDNEAMMQEIIDGFPYKETTDQLKAIRAVEEDMSRAVPMERLIVGDVGFGKTEIAIRAAARAVFAGKQVAVMAPTTLLAQQHYETFSSRFSDTAVSVELVSRFTARKKQSSILAGLKSGNVDILIGTHRMLSKDVTFKDLGLVVIDEEHRFGVMQKEKMKHLMPGVDVLMLSATPIPRSLSMSLNGLRDMSLLETPPQSRLPVITTVRPFSEDMLKKAVLREKNRGGQVFYVHNRINGLAERAVMLRRLFPDFSIAVAHSKTEERELEQTMMNFAAGKIDILLCTTIVESGLDIPRANTLIVDDANELGLAQMYQLRGRVGRREEQAYAFLFYPANVQLSVESSERLEAIAELDELGSGYRLAQRDLEIRGGGDLIGIAQHGAKTKIGYTKYCELLADEIKKIKGVYRAQPIIEVGYPISIPCDYLPQENLRVTLYRRLMAAYFPNEITMLREETQDRFGKIPQELDFLFNLAVVRCAACDLDIERIECSRFETKIHGACDGRWKKIKLPPRWNRFETFMAGPGTKNAVKDIAAAIVKQINGG